MGSEALFWLAMIVASAFFAARVIRRAKRRASFSDKLAESFERQRVAEHGGFRGNDDFSYARERFSREPEDWAA